MTATVDAPVLAGERTSRREPRWARGALLAATAVLWPASSLPCIAGSTDNSLWQLAIGYNGLGRILGGDGNGGGGGGQTSRFGGSTGIGRLFGAEWGAEISWLLPAALIAMVALVVVAGPAPRTDRIRASAVVWGGWLLVSG